MALHDCDTRTSVQQPVQQPPPCNGRLEPEIWEDATDPALNMAELDAKVPGGRMAHAIVCDSPEHPDHEIGTLGYRLTELVDVERCATPAEEIPPAGWVS